MSGGTCPGEHVWGKCPGATCPAEHVRGNMSWGTCLGESVRGQHVSGNMSGGTCPGEHVRGACPKGTCPGENCPDPMCCDTSRLTSLLTAATVILCVRATKVSAILQETLGDYPPPGDSSPRSQPVLKIPRVTTFCSDRNSKRPTGRGII